MEIYFENPNFMNFNNVLISRISVFCGQGKSIAV